jgi:2-keto-4-pentenoate hydratase/2-oxohepta-3-ene-1,7-dioic acid hydratase in catechol pathway
VTFSERPIVSFHTRAHGLPAGAVMFGGTLPALGGIRPADRFEMELLDPVLKRRITHAYDVAALPVVI